MMKREEEKIFWNNREFCIFLENVTDKDMKLIFELVYKNGIAVQEALRLRIKDFNINKGCITVNGQICQEQIGNYTGNKLPDSYQVDMLEGQHERIQKYLADLSEYEQEECIFQMSRQKLEREFYKVIEKTLLRKMKIDNLRYCQRHTYQDSVNGKIYCLQGYSAEGELSMNESKIETNGKMEVPIWKKLNLTLAEAAVYSGIGINNLRKLCDENQNTLVLWIGTKRLIKRKKLEELTEKMYVL